MIEFIDDLFPDEDYVERQRREAEKNLGKLDEALVMHIRIISAAPEDQRSELHQTAWRALMCGCKYDMTAEILYRAVRARRGISPLEEFTEWCLCQFGAIDGAYIATGAPSVMVH